MKNTLKVGDHVSLTKAFTDEEVRQFSKLSADTNPIHLDDAFAAASVFGQRVVHGMLLASLFSGLIGTKLPGVGTIYLGQSLSFKVPVPIGEPVTASVEIIKIRPDKPIITLRTQCIDSKGRVVVEGESVVKVAP